MTFYLTTNSTDSFTLGTGSATVVGNLVLADSTANTMITGSGTQAKIVRERGISPKLYFSFVKSKLKKTESEEVKKRLRHMSLLLEGADSCGQKGLSERLEQQMYVLIKDQEAAACGYGRFVLDQDIEKFRGIVRERTVNLCKLEHFPRAIPIKIRTIIREVKVRELFDEFWVLYNDLTKEPLAKTTKEKIREKDPILFGRFKYDDSRFFYITDWVDEHCDLTLDKFMKELKKEKVGDEYLIGEVTEPTADDIIAIKRKVIQRAEALESTTRDSWRKMEEIQAKYDAAEEVRKKQAGIIQELRNKAPTKRWKFWK